RDALSQTASNGKTPYISQSSITFATQSAVTNKHTNSNSGQFNNNFQVNRSLICSHTDGEPVVNRPSTTTRSQWRPIDIKNTMEYRELEKKNKDLSNKVDNLKEALSKERKDRKRMEETHILKPRGSFWNELAIFMDSHTDLYMGDGRTIDQIGCELGLSDQTIQSVQRNADRPDKVAMNIWRRLCPTVDDRVFVQSIKRVPISTLENIYAFSRLSHPKNSFSFKKMRNDIAANIRQGTLTYRSRETLLVNQIDGEENASDDDADEMNDEEDNEIHRIADKKSRFSRYRDRIRQRKQLDLMEMMATDDLNEASKDEVYTVDPQTVHDNDATSMLTCDEHNAASSSVSKEVTEQCSLEEHNDEDDVHDSFQLNDVGSSDGSDNNDDESEDDDVEEISNAQSDFYDDYCEKQRLPDATELSVMLFLFWKRHNISKAAANDICRIINMFNVPNMPKDFRSVMNYLKRNNPILLEGNHSFICSSCGNRCANASKCDSTRCQSSNLSVQHSTSVIVFPLASQICSILERETLIMPTFESNFCDDISNSQRSQEIASKERQTTP
ncbi:unnamed protein product, partial [Adineta ricciae]